MAATGESHTADKAIACDGSITSYGVGTDPFDTDDTNGTAKFIGLHGITEYDIQKVQTIRAASAAFGKPQRRSNRDLSKNELIHMLCCLEGELQARDIVIAALRNDRVKQLIHTIHNKNLPLNDPDAALFRDKVAVAGNHVSRQSSTTAIHADLEVRAIIEQQMESLCQVVTKQRQTQVRMVTVLKESLQNNQRMRQELEEEKYKHEHDTAQGDDITYGLEMERTKLKQELEMERTNRKKLEKDVKKIQETLEFERSRQKQIVLLLLAERKKIIMKYIEERKRSEDLAQILSEEKQRSDSIAEGLEEESKKSLRMEAELEKQTVTIDNERKTMKINLAKEEKRIKELEIELAQLKAENDVFRKQSVALRLQSSTSHNVPVPTLPAKVRNIPDDTITPNVLPTSLMNVAKIVQPTATVSSVPVSGPTTGIARSISPGQSLRQQPQQTNDVVIGVASSGPGTNIVSAQQPTATTFNAPPPAKVTPRKLTTSTTSGSGVCPNPITQQAAITTSVPPIPQLSSSSSSSLSSVPASIDIPSGYPAINAPSTPTTVLAPIGTGRGIPPPIPPNKPIVPPKREPSISRLAAAIIPNSTTTATSIAAANTSSTNTTNPGLITGTTSAPPPITNISSSS